MPLCTGWDFGLWAGRTFVLMIVDIMTAPSRSAGFEYRSKQEINGWPLIHINIGWDPETGRSRVARGVVAIGSRAYGVVSIGAVALGVVTLAGVGLGLVSHSALSRSALSPWGMKSLSDLWCSLWGLSSV